MGEETGSVGGKHPKPQDFPVNYSAQLELARRGDTPSCLMASPDVWPLTKVIKGSKLGRHYKTALEPTALDHERLNFQPKPRQRGRRNPRRSSGLGPGQGGSSTSLPEVQAASAEPRAKRDDRGTQNREKLENGPL